MKRQKGFTPLEIKPVRGQASNGLKISNLGSKRFLTGFTLIELLVVIAIIALLMAILMPALARVKRLANDAVCKAHLKQWCLIFSMYADDGDGRFFNYDGSQLWMLRMEPYYINPKIRFCPMAKKLLDRGGLNLGATFYAWGPTMWGGTSGSYGLNSWILNPDRAQPPPHGLGTHSNYWRSPNVKQANRIPMFLDCWWVDCWPRNTDEDPPEYDGDLSGSDMCRICINRHNGGVNVGFLDFSVRKIGLKELWTLKWHREYNTCGQWTKCGGVKRGEWPKWMRNFKDY